MAAEFKEFCRKQNIEHIATTPYHPRLNGCTEKFVDIFKRALKKSKGRDELEESLQQVFGSPYANSKPKHT